MTRITKDLLGSGQFTKDVLINYYWSKCRDTLPKTHIFAPENRPFTPKKETKLVFQPSFFRGEPLGSPGMFRKRPTQRTPGAEGRFVIHWSRGRCKGIFGASPGRDLTDRLFHIEIYQGFSIFTLIHIIICTAAAPKNKGKDEDE